jgi:hypothetical protein
MFRPHLVKYITDSAPASGTPDRAGTDAHDLKPQNIDVIKRAMVGVNKEGTGARAFAGAEYVAAGKTGTAQVFSLKGAEYKTGKLKAEGTARPRPVHRLRAGRQSEDRAGRAGRERRLRRPVGGADRAHGARLLPARQEAGGAAKEDEDARRRE